MHIFLKPWFGLSVSRWPVGATQQNDVLVVEDTSNALLSVDKFIKNTSGQTSWLFFQAPLEARPWFQLTHLDGRDAAHPHARTTQLIFAPPSSAPPPKRSDPSADADKLFSWDKLTLKQLLKLITGDRPQDIRQAALAVLIDRYNRGDIQALFIVAACSEQSDGARIKLHDIIARNDIAYRHLQQMYRQTKSDPHQLRSLFFAFRSLANRINDLIADDFKLLIEKGEMLPLGDSKIQYFNAVISNLFDGDLSDWAKAGSFDAAEELLIRYLSLKDSQSPEEKADAESALVELAEAAHDNEHAQDILLKAGSIDPNVWGEIDRLAIEVPTVAEQLAEIIEAGTLGYYFTSLAGAAVESPSAALLLCRVAETFHDKNDFYRRDQVLIAIKDLNLLRYREYAKTNPQAIEALVRLDFLGAQQARRELTIAAQENTAAKQALEALLRNEPA